MKKTLAIVSTESEKITTLANRLDRKGERINQFLNQHAAMHFTKHY